MLAALPDATILELGEWGIRESTWDDLEVVRLHRDFLESPGGCCGTCSTERGGAGAAGLECVTKLADAHDGRGVA